MALFSKKTIEATVNTGIDARSEYKLVSAPPNISVSASRPRSMTKHKQALKFGYDASMTHSRTARHWQMADNLSAKSANSKSVRQSIVKKSRYEYYNNTYCYGMINSYAEWVIGTGPKLKVVNKDEGIARDVEFLFSEWADYVRLTEKLMTIKISELRDGEIFNLLINNERNLKEIAIGLDLFLMETERVTSSYSFSDLPLPSLDPNNIDGVIIDDLGNPVAYQILIAHPGDTDSWQMMKTRTYPAYQVIHMFRPRRAEQYRGIPESTAALELFGVSRDYTNAVLTAAEIAANLSAVATTPELADASGNPITSGDTEEVPDTNFDIIPMNMGSFITFPGGWNVSQLKAEQPTTTYPDFDKRLINSQGRNFNMPMNIASGSSEGYNYASGRLDHQSFTKTVALEQKFIVDKLLSRIFTAWWNELKLLAEFKTITRAFAKKSTIHKNAIPGIRWFFDGVPHVDPLKNASAFKILRDSQGISLATHFGQQGLDWRDEIEQQVIEEAEIKKLRKNNELEDADATKTD